MHCLASSLRVARRTVVFGFSKRNSVRTANVMRRNCGNAALLFGVEFGLLSNHCRAEGARRAGSLSGSCVACHNFGLRLTSSKRWSSWTSSRWPAVCGSCVCFRVVAVWTSIFGCAKCFSSTDVLCNSESADVFCTSPGYCRFPRACSQSCSAAVAQRPFAMRPTDATLYAFGIRGCNLHG